MKIKQKDKVRVIAGKNKNSEGKVLEVKPRRNKILVEGVNIVKRHQKAVGRTREGGIVEKPAFIDVSNVQLLCPKCGVSTRVGYEGAGKEKKRKCKKCSKTFS